MLKLASIANFLPGKSKYHSMLMFEPIPILLMPLLGCVTVWLSNNRMVINTYEVKALEFFFG